ncbi:MAG TPA: N-acetyl sugar amidotransferase [Candidatus Omnitrophota bacterium]|nr:N-acetyl sugar amidotransferase [Candidatus Omnitrophota bacterium]
MTETKYGLPSHVQFCKKCVISNQRPSSTVEFRSTASEKKQGISFDKDGICDACKYAEYKATKIDWEKREAELKELLNRYRRIDGYWDCIVPVSGGKDSSFAAHVLKYKYGMHPLLVTWAPHEYTQIGFKNLQSLIHAGFDHILITPNGTVHRYLTKMAFLNLCHPFQPFIIGQKSVGPRLALEKKIPLIFYGENQAEYGNKIEENDIPFMNSDFFSSQRDFEKIVLGGVRAQELMHSHHLTKNDIEIYTPPSKEEIAANKIIVYYLGYYLKWDPQEAFYYAAEHTGFQPNTQRTEGTYSKYSSIDDKIDMLHYYTTLIKFGIGRATYDASQEIRNNKITREEGIALVNKYDTEFPQLYFRDCLAYMDIDEKCFWETIEKFRSAHLWKKVNNTWCLRHTCAKDGVDD